MEAFPAILREEPRAKLLWVGDGILRTQLVARARELGVADRLVLVGLVQPTEVADYLALVMSWYISHPGGVASGGPAKLPVGCQRWRIHWMARRRLSYPDRLGVWLKWGIAQPWWMRWLDISRMTIAGGRTGNGGGPWCSSAFRSRAW